jgi:hypothetical protein
VRRSSALAWPFSTGKLGTLLQPWAGGDIPALVARLKTRQQERDAAAKELRAATLARRAPAPQVSRKALRARLVNWRGLLAGDPSEACRLLEAALADRIVFTPIEVDGEMRFDVRVPLQLDRLMVGILPMGLASPTGFEPVFQP